MKELEFLEDDPSEHSESLLFEAWNAIREENKSYISAETLRVFIFALSGIVSEWMLMPEDDDVTTSSHDTYYFEVRETKHLYKKQKNSPEKKIKV